MTDIIVLNGTSSAGKTTIARALRTALPSFWYYASDQLADAGFRSLVPDNVERERFFDGFHRSIAAFAEAGNPLLVEHIVESRDWSDALSRLLASHRVFWVGVHAPLDELERRERMRKDRQTGEARFHLRTHDFCRYDMTVDSTRPTAQVVSDIVEAWKRWRSIEPSNDAPSP
ncbi:chloramphenicol phosphotransferase CPT family protein [Variovorax sp. W6]|uniref:chloramphenicol phosphotransferase CPT family protein n=1 Tax=Variovorax sp. W6 TaxID=3093895 RepID=UPI003D806DC2